MQADGQDPEAPDARQHLRGAGLCRHPQAVPPQEADCRHLHLDPQQVPP